MSRYYVGLDVHQASISIAVLDQEGKLVAESVVETSAATVLTFLGGLRGQVEATFEAGTPAVWLYDVLRAARLKAVVCDPRQHKLLLEGNKSDKADARKLAQVLRAGLLSPVDHGEPGVRDLRELIRSYEYLVEDSRRVKNRIKARFRSRASACAGDHVYRPGERQQGLGKLAGAGVRARVERLYSELNHLAGLRREARHALVAERARHPARKLLRQLPTLGAVRVAQRVSVVAPPHRFRTKRQFWSYCGLAGRTHSSADYRFEGSARRRVTKKAAPRGLGRDHHRTLKSVFKGAALTASRVEPFRSGSGELGSRGRRPELARVTIARRIAAITLSVWKRGETFAESRISRQAA